jgi:hypothetical protein
MALEVLHRGRDMARAGARLAVDVRGGAVEGGDQAVGGVVVERYVFIDGAELRDVYHF